LLEKNIKDYGHFWKYYNESQHQQINNKLDKNNNHNKQVVKELR